MHDIEPHYGWEKYYNSSEDSKSPFFEKEYNYELLTNDIYGYYINPAWDYIGSETLYAKILFADYTNNCAIIELIGEWNDTLHNDIMHLKRNLIDELIYEGINKFIIIGENIFNFHGSDDCYYEEWFEDIEDGWIVSIGFRDFVLSEWRKFGIDAYVNYGGELEVENWRTLQPLSLYKFINDKIVKRLGN
ncbi:MAG: hypothetical protein SFY32_06130 [Bacteroidota bacterium]|nr:hypothetical protein [Bacteroidota bacterium]